MKPINSMSLTFDSVPENEGFARSAAAGFLAQIDPTVEELCDIRTAVSEAVTNSIVHGYRTFPGKIRLNARIYPWSRFLRPIRKVNGRDSAFRSCSRLWIRSA